MLYRETITISSQIHTKHINTLCGQNVELLNVKPGGTYSDHWAFRGKAEGSFTFFPNCFKFRPLASVLLRTSADLLVRSDVGYRWNAPKPFDTWWTHCVMQSGWIRFFTGSVIWTLRRDAISQSALDWWWVSEIAVGMWVLSLVWRCRQYSCCRFCCLRCLIECLAGYRNNNSLYVCVYVCVRVRKSRVRLCILHVRGDHSEARAGGVSKFRYLVTHLSDTSVLKYRVNRNDCRGFNNLSHTIHLR